MFRMACRVYRKRIPGVRSLTPTPSWGPEISSDCFAFIFVAAVCSGCRRVFVFLLCFCFAVAVQCESLVRMGLSLSVFLVRPVGLFYPVPGFVLTVLGFPL